MSLKNDKTKYTVSPNSKNGYREVHVNYSHNGKDYKQLHYVRDNPKFKESDYIREAKSKFKPNFKFQAHPRAHFHFPVIPVVAGLVVAGGLGTGGYFTYKYVTSTPATNICVVNFDSDGGSYVASKSVNKGKAFDAPENPIKQVDTFFYTFEGWFLNDTKFDFALGTTVDITLKAHWSGTPPVPPGSCIVNFDSDGGSYVASKIVTKGEPFNAPTNPTKKEGDFEYTFDGWFLGDHLFIFGTDTVNDTTTLIAHWGGEPTKKYNVTFNGVQANIWENDVNHGDYYTYDYNVNKELSFTIKPADGKVGLTDAISFKVNGVASEPTTYEKQDDGSYKLEFTVLGVTSIVVNSVNKNKVTFVTNCETTLPDIYIMDGETIEEPEIENGGHILMGWFTDTNCTNIYDLASPVYSDLTLYAGWSSSDVNQPLTFSIYFESAGDKSIKLSCINEFDDAITRNLQYKVNDGEWVSKTITVDHTTSEKTIDIGLSNLKEDDVICFRGDNKDGWSYGNPINGDEFLLKFITTGIYYDVSGNVMSLIHDGDDLASQKTIPCDYCFGKLFQNADGIFDASELVLPATTLSNYCYYSMFYESDLEYVPECLVVDYVPPYACDSMFYNSKLYDTPIINVGNVDYRGFYCMFCGCGNIIKISDLIIGDVVGESGCDAMFYQCCESYSVTIHNIIIGNVTADYGCYEMFEDCESLSYIGNIVIGSAEGDNACNCMFYSCNLSIVGMLKINNYSFGKDSLKEMFCYDDYLGHVEIDIDNPGGEDWFYDEAGAIVTEDWMGYCGSGAGGTCTFVWHNAPEGIELTYGDSYIPEYWGVILC